MQPTTLIHETLIQLNDQSDTAQRIINAPYRIHHMLEAINPSRERILWRFANNRLIVRHPKPLDWMKLDTEFPFLGERRHRAIDTQKPEESHFCFNLLAYSRSYPKPGQPWIPKKPEQYLDWISKASSEHGFETVDLEIIKQYNYYIRTSSMPIYLQPVELVGIIKVVNASSFQKTISSGIGRMKAYGCGLMLIQETDAAHIPTIE
jgi:hypothetical protein